MGPPGFGFFRGSAFSGVRPLCRGSAFSGVRPIPGFGLPGFGFFVEIWLITGRKLEEGNYTEIGILKKFFKIMEVMSALDVMTMSQSYQPYNSANCTQQYLHISKSV